MTPMAHAFTQALARRWWVLLVRGLAALAFGVLTWLQPQASLAALVLLFGLYVLFDGAMGVGAALASRKSDAHWWVMLLWGLVSVAAGGLTLLAPGVTALVLLIYIAVWAFFTGVLQIMAAIRLREAIQGEWLLGLAGLASALVGIFLIWQPEAGALALAWAIAAYAVLWGVLLVALAFKLRALRG